MNVLYIVGGEGNRYGSEIIAINLIRGGKTSGINYTVITANKGAVSDACEALGIEYYVVPFTFFVYKAMKNKFADLVKKSVWRCRAEYLSSRAIKLIERRVDFHKIDLIHTNLSRDLIGGMLSRKHHIPHVWHIQELYNAHYQLSFLRPRQLDWMARHGDSFIAISDLVAKDWAHHGLPREKLVTIYNGIETEHILAKESYVPGTDLNLVMVGHICFAKGQELAIRSLALLPDYVKEHIQVDCYGGGAEAYKKYLAALAEEHGVHFCIKGYCAEIGSILKDYDIGLNCSRGEGFGLSTVEYMAAGLCVVAANTGANEEIIHDKENGLIFEYSKESELAKLIAYLYENRTLIPKLAECARIDALSKYSLERMQGTVYAHYNKMAKQGRDCVGSQANK